MGKTSKKEVKVPVDAKAKEKAEARAKVRKEELEEAQLTATARFMKKAHKAGLVRSEEDADRLKELFTRAMSRRAKHQKAIPINYKKFIVTLHGADEEVAHFTGQTPPANSILNQVAQNIQRFLTEKMKDKADLLNRSSHTEKAIEPIVNFVFGPAFQADRKAVLARVQHHVRLYETSLLTDEHNKKMELSKEERLGSLRKHQKKQQQKEDPQPMDEDGEEEEEKKPKKSKRGKKEATAAPAEEAEEAEEEAQEE